MVKEDYLIISKDELFNLKRKFSIPPHLPKGSGSSINVVLIKLNNNGNRKYILILSEDMTLFNFDVFVPDNNVRSGSGKPLLKKHERFKDSQRLNYKKKLKNTAKLNNDRSFVINRDSGASQQGPVNVAQCFGNQLMVSILELYIIPVFRCMQIYP